LNSGAQAPSASSNPNNGTDHFMSADDKRAKG